MQLRDPVAPNVRRFMTPREPSDSSCGGVCRRLSQATRSGACAGSGRRPRYMNPVCYLMATDRVGMAVMPGRAVPTILFTSIGIGY